MKRLVAVLLAAVLAGLVGCGGSGGGNIRTPAERGNR
jgi:hypothetical protein